jgi:hypothetical protein
MNGFYLKLLAVITMLIDHIGAVLFPQYLVFRMIGRLSFPIYCFLLVEGYTHTSNLTKYMKRLLIFAFISEIPFDLAFNSNLFFPKNQNVFFTLFLGLLAIYCIDHFNTNKLKQILYVISICLIALLINCDYNFIGVLMILGFYLYKNNKKMLVVFEAVLSLTLYLETFGLISFIPIFLYNKKRGYNIKYLFYIFYPVHLLILYFISVSL